MRITYEYKVILAELILGSKTNFLTSVSDTNTARLESDRPVPRPRVTASTSGYTEEEKLVLNHTSNINDNIFVPFMDVDLKDRFVFSIPFTDRVSFNMEFKGVKS